jgi:dihydrofolate reductase
LLGRRSYEWFAKRQPMRPGEWFDRVQQLPKYVVSTTLKDPEWDNSTLIAGDAVKQLSELKQKVDGEIIVYGSYQLVRTLIEQDLADELRLFVFPVVLGTGARVFDGIRNTKPMRLIDTRVVAEGLVFYAYEFVRDTASTTAG